MASERFFTVGEPYCGFGVSVFVAFCVGGIGPVCKQHPAGQGDLAVRDCTCLCGGRK